MHETERQLQETVDALERLFAGRQAAAIEIQYGSIHLRLVNRFLSDDMEAIQRTLAIHFRPVQHWRVQRVNSLLLLAITPNEAQTE